MIKYAAIIPDSVVDGPGIRLVAFLQGCPRHCQGCHNPALIPVNGGVEINEKDFAKMLLKKITPKHSGITFSGGDPLMQPEALLNVIAYIRARKPEINIWVYTGYLFEEVKHLPVMKLIDVLVDGPFILEKKDISLPFRGSSNQRIIDVTKSLKLGRDIEIDTKANIA